MQRDSSKLKDVAYAKIREMIISGQIKPGQKLTESGLTEQLEMGRTPVREALLTLAHDQLLIIHPRKYIEVAQISPERVNEIFELRICLEPAVLRRHGSSINLVKLMEIKQNILHNIAIYEQWGSGSAKNSIDSQSPAPYPSDVVNIDEQFHALLVSSANNPQIDQVFSNFMDYVSLLWGINSRLVASRSYASDKEHLQIIDAILDGKIAYSAQLLEQHLELSRNALIEGMIQEWNDHRD